MEKQILKSDKEYKKKTLIILIISIIAGLGVIVCFQVYIQDIKELAKYDHEQAFEKILFLLRIIMVSIAFTLTSFGIYIIRIAIKAIITEQFPPPGMKVIRETRLLTGRSAKQRGVIGIILAIAIIITGITFPAFLYLKMDKVFKKPVQQINMGSSGINTIQGFNSITDIKTITGY
ncbi:Uncharacterized protein dnl_41810 [Desulfonema limicola]|uniref:Uncharacterized protein n=1 Tax=Desulfonema limicola TaxID=45656 RepID=A0A975BAX9_9BACT|nr:hypothetical protein [Desulfonema limicola]QTA81830.1 Uncharacterized protein dnl_41810 [Desulfonema limicola]